MLGPVGSPQPNRDVEISHGIPKTEGKHGKTPRWRTWRNRAVPPSLPCIPRPVQKGQRSQGEGIEVLLSWLFCLARTDRRCPPAGLQLQHQRCEQPQVGPAETSPGDRRRSLDAGKLSWEARVTLESSSGQSDKLCLGLVPTSRSCLCHCPQRSLHHPRSPPTQNSLLIHPGLNDFLGSGTTVIHYLMELKKTPNLVNHRVQKVPQSVPDYLPGSYKFRIAEKLLF